MKLFVNEKIITTEDQPLIIVLTDMDKKNIANMDPKCNVYCQYQKENHYVEEIESLTDAAKAEDLK